MNNVNATEKIHTLSLGALTLLSKKAMGESMNCNYSFAPELEKAGFFEKINEDPGWRLKKGILSIEDGSIQEVIELQARKYEEFIYNKNYSRKTT